ncbi:autotransporter outer membrane beta-barrel domain-containing protein [Serratia aquatilis]|uniref:Autotransporter outer membrane beta-barrel domain-containing protein n=1 Tax=Serratia aquatilis TaxID=1737515 RepID=A0ABV6EIV8_9GAMM
MNRFFKIIWNVARQSWVVASEIARGVGKSSSVGASAKPKVEAPHTSKPPLLRMLAIASAVLTTNLLMTAGSAFAACTPVASIGGTTTCTAGTDQTVTVGTGPGMDNVTVNVGPSAQINVPRNNAISLGNNANIFIDNDAVVQVTSVAGDSGFWNAGPNTIEFGSNSTLNVAVGASVLSYGDASQAEAVNPIGSGNIIINRGLIYGQSSAAIWFQNEVTGTANTIDNYGILQTGANGGNANVIGSSNVNDVVFINRTGASVIGNLSLGGGNDSLTLEAGSVITGSFDGGTGTDSLTLSGIANSNDFLSGSINNFQTLLKEGEGQWTLTGSIGNNGGNTPLAVTVDQGTLTLTGNNSSFNGTIQVNSTGILEALAQSLPSSVTDNGLVRFIQSTAGTYAGLISGSGAVQKTEAGKLTISTAQTYTGGTIISGGILSVSSDANMGTAAGGLTLDGGTLETSTSLTTGRAVTITANNGTIQTDTGTVLTSTGGITGATGALTKTGTGTLVLTAVNTYGGGTTISGGTLQLGNGGTVGSIVGNVENNGTLAFNNPGSTTFAGTIDGTGAVQQLSGITTLNAVNTYSGGTTISGGTLSVGTDANLGDAVGGLALDGGTLEANASFTTGRTVTITGSNGTIQTDAGATLTAAGVITGATGALTKTGTGTLALTAANTYSGGSTISSGTLQIGDGGTTGSLVGNVTNNGTLAFNRSNAQSFTGTITGTGSLTQIGTGVTTLTAGGSSVGDASVAAGTLNLAQTGAFTTTGAYNTATGATTQIVANATLAVGTAFTQAVGSILNVALGSVQPVITAATADLNGTLNITGFGASIPDTASALTSTQFNVIRTAAAGGITNDFSTVTLGGAASPADYLRLAGSKSVNAQDYNIGFGLTWLAGGENGNGVFTLAGVGDLFNVDVALANQTGPFTSGWDGNTLTKAGAGTLILSAANSYTGPTVINSGTLRTGIANTFANSSAVSVAGGATLDLDNFDQTANNLSGVGNVTLGSATLTVNDTVSTTFGGVISGAGSLVKTGSSTLTLSGENTYSGGTTISDGTLQLGNGGTTGGVAGDIVNNANLVVNRANSLILVGTLSGNGSFTQAGPGTTTLGSNGSQGSVNVQQGTLKFLQAGTFNTTGNYTTAAGATTDIGAANSQLNVGGEFMQAENAILSVTVGANPDIIADTAVLAGTLVVNGFNSTEPVTATQATTTIYNLIHTTSGITGNFDNNPLPGTGMDYLLHDGYLSTDGNDYNLGFRLAWTQGGQSQGTGSFTMAPNSAFNIDIALTDQAGSFDSGWDGESLTKNGEGLLILSAVQQYSGSTVLNGGTIQTDIAQAFASSNAVEINGGVLNLNGFNQTAHNLSGTVGEIRLTNGAQLLLDNTADTTYAGLITDSGSLLKQGIGMFTLTGDASHSGVTTIDAGTLSIGNGGTTGSITGDIVNNATLIFNRSDASDYTGLLSGEGEFYKQGTGVLTLAGGLSSQGSVEVQAGTLTLGQTGSSVTNSLITSGNYTTDTGATTVLGVSNSTLTVGGAFTQQSGSVLNVTLGASPDITAQTAQLDGALIVNGFTDTQDPTKASSVISRAYILLRTTGGITGDFTNNPLESYGLDYLLHDGYKTLSDLDYELGFRLAWIEGEEQYSTGNFTLNDGTGFSVDIALDNQTVPNGGFATGWDGQSLVKDGAGRLVFSAVNGYTGSTTLNNGVLQLDIANSIKASRELIVNGGIVNLNGNDQQFNRLSGTGGEVQLNGATLTAVNADTSGNSGYAGAITGNGTFIKEGAGNLTLSGDTAWVGDTKLQGGTLILDGTSGGGQLVSNVIGQSGTQLSLQNGASLTGWIDPTDVIVDSSSYWTMTADSLVDNLSNSGTVTFVAPTANEFKTLTLNSNYAGNNGLLVMNTQLGDDNSLTDKLVVAGNTSGTTRVQINNAGGTGANTLEGIEVVRVGGESNGEFVQNGRIAAGAYDYTLGRGDNVGTAGNWYLTSKSNNDDSDIRPEAGAYNANLAAANNMFVTRLHDRLGETQYIDVLSGERKVTSMWLRNEGGHNNFRDESGQLRTQSNRYVLQLGGDIAQWSNGDLDRFHLGMMAGYGDNKSNTVSRLGYDAKGAVDGYSLGIYGTWYANAADKSGWYVDSWLQYSWFNNTVTGQNQASETYKSKGVTASIESGYTFMLGENTVRNHRYFVQPKAQLTWMGVKADDHQEAGGTWVKGEGDGNLQTRLGVKAFINGYSKQDQGKDRVFQPFVEANWVHNSKDFGSNMDGLSIRQDGAANIAELKVGMEGQINKQLNLWGNVGQQVGNKGYNDTQVILGIKYNF